MKSKDVIFDENLEFYTSLKGLKFQVCITLSDGLYASEEELSEEYKTKIANFLNSVEKWYDKAVDAIIERAKQKYKINAHVSDLTLQSIFILYEQNDDELYGLSFRVEFDVEHGCGLKIRGNDFEIVEIGTGDVSFC